MKVVFALRVTINTGDYSNTQLGITLEAESPNPDGITAEEVAVVYTSMATHGRELVRDQIIAVTEPGYIRRRALAQIGIVEEAKPSDRQPDEEDTVREMEASDDHYYDDDKDYNDDDDYQDGEF